MSVGGSWCGHGSTVGGKAGSVPQAIQLAGFGSTDEAAVMKRIATWGLSMPPSGS
ncbi:MAG: hypothetical protein JRJ24_09415 [Deltaproteobacteria bacterium]|nr:hypothetical protein [Deltaproteobacteria bacterium]